MRYYKYVHHHNVENEEHICRYTIKQMVRIDGDMLKNKINRIGRSSTHTLTILSMCTASTFFFFISKPKKQKNATFTKDFTSIAAIVCVAAECLYRKHMLFSSCVTLFVKHSMDWTGLIVLET